MLTGSFAAMPFPDLLQWVGDSRQSGALFVSQASEQRQLSMVDGAVVAIGSGTSDDCDVGRVAVARGLVTDATLERALRRTVRRGRCVEDVLVDVCGVSPRGLADAKRRHAMSLVLELLLWGEARFAYLPAEPAATHATPGCAATLELASPVPVRELLMECLRRYDEWQGIAELLGSEATTVRLVRSGGRSRVVRELAKARTAMTLRELCARVPLPRIEIMEQLGDAYRADLVAFESPAAGGDNGAVEDCLAAVQALLGARQYDEAAALLGSVLTWQPQHAQALALMRRARQCQTAELYAECPPLSVPVIVVGEGELRGLRLTTRESYLLSHINGERDVASIAMAARLDEVDTLRSLRMLRHAGLVAFT